tara:strand:+ start:324 stop:662 length:339 start_codon:yes stop_codon:yes gene_type:complete
MHNTMVEGQIPKKPSAKLDWIGITVILLGFFLALGSIRFTGWFIPTNLERVYLICGMSLLLGSIPIVWNQILRERYSKAFEDHDGKNKVKFLHLFFFFLAIDLVILIFSTVL